MDDSVIWVWFYIMYQKSDNNVQLLEYECFGYEIMVRCNKIFFLRFSLFFKIQALDYFHYGA